MSNIFCYLLCLTTEAVILWIYSDNLFIPKHPVSMRAITITLTFIPLSLISSLRNTGVNTILFFSALLVFFMTQYKICWYIAIFHAVLMTAFNGVCELLIYGIINSYFPNFLTQTPTENAGLLCAFLSKLIYCTILFTLIHFFRSRQLPDQQQDKSVFLLFLVPLTSLGMMLSFLFYNDALSSVPELNWLVTICAACLLVLNLLVFGINQYNQKRHQEYAQMQILLQKEADSAEYYRSLVQQNENQRVLIHDIRKHLASIDALNKAGEQNKVHSYIQQLQDSAHLNESLQLSDNQLFNAILCRYMHKCESQHIAFRTNIRSHTVDFLSDTDLTALFCNLLDNALCAADTLPDAFIDICTYTKDNSPFTIITIINSCRENPFTGPGGTLVSNKPDHQLHGLGLKSVQRVVDNYDGAMKMYYDLPTLTFHTILTLRSSS